MMITMSLLRRRCVSLISTSWSSKPMKSRKYMLWWNKSSTTIFCTSKSSISTVSKIKSSKRLRRDSMSYSFSIPFIKRTHMSRCLQWGRWTWTRWRMMMKMWRKSCWMPKSTCKMLITIKSLKMKKVRSKIRWKKRVKKKKIRLSNSSMFNIITLTISLTLTLGLRRQRVVRATLLMPLILYKVQQHSIHIDHLLPSLISK